MRRSNHTYGRRGEEMAEAKNKQDEIANKRVALTPSTWAALSNIKPPGKSLGETVADLIAEHQKRMLERDLDEIDAHGNFIPGKAKKEPALLRDCEDLYRRPCERIHTGTPREGSPGDW
jgi:hypothetical protein